ncbi:Ubiquitin-conjugating enzyme E2 2 [Mucor velutinosus]|uniref:Ubiquitin-conjugating enzyme E2 2 n=1 Tax=Mucor velutinosus TaxID=708070 RepID=A0AAN7DMK9_9FUNG|nr:Ubiquitin-conjugating enzyme E2 2 [Mucor velutinosus]
MMNKCLSGYIDRFVQLYLDDILVYSPTAESHLEHIRLVLERFRQFKLYANPKKCKFNQREVEFLGMKVSADGILPSDSKIKAIKNWPVPTNVQEVRQFVGLASHYRRFIRQFSSVAAPLTELTKAFDQLKSLLTHAPCLQPPDVSKPYIIETDSSDFGCGAVLLQKDDQGVLHPLAFESKKFSMAERNYPAQERELLGVLHALRVWRCFIDGADYVVYTDHNPLQYLRSQSKPTARLVRWLSEIETYDPKILYKPGKINQVPDALSCRDGASCVAAETSMEPCYLYSVESNIMVHPSDWPTFYLTKQELVPGSVKPLLKSNANRFILKNEKVYRKVKIGEREFEARFCPFSNRATLVNRFHEGFGHAGQGTVFELMRKRWWWPNMRADIQS